MNEFKREENTLQPMVDPSSKFTYDKPSSGSVIYVEGIAE